MSSFKQAFEKNLNDELEKDHKDPPPAIDIEMQQDAPFNPPFHGPAPTRVYPSYPPKRSGVNVPTFLFALFIAVFIFESAILFVYTCVALWNTVPRPASPASAPPACNCPAAAPMIIYPQLAAAGAGTVTQTQDHSITVTVTASPSSSSSSSSKNGSTETSSSFSSSPSTAARATNTALLGLLSVLASNEKSTASSSVSLSTSSGLVVVTAPVPTITVLSTAPAELPSITTMTVLSTASAPAPTRSTVTSTAIITAKQ
ncbi:hypothetical protein BDV97DRAFT_402020 [Delphinella strobiligena]|nr:hypothetical protein BDV97DRAFT_402020 [Delphinella strobiligena]